MALAGGAQALPSYARQTGQECAACHNGFPELTPYGRLFKLNAYTFSGGQSSLPPLAAMVIPSFARTQAPQYGAAPQHFSENNNATIQTTSLFYGGAIADHLGAFAQVTYDSVPQRLHWDNLDVRYARTTNLFDTEMILGATVNNNPTVSDVWNSTPAWAFPYVASPFQPTGAASTLIEGGLAQQVAGLTAYGFWNRLIYVEVGGYRTLSRKADKTLGVDTTGISEIKGIAPYWRIAVEPTWGRNSFEVGTFGIAASIVPGRVTGAGTDHTTDIGFDAQYQFLGDRDSISVQATWITENQSLSASQGLGNSENGRNHLRSLKLKTSYLYDQTYGATLAYARVDGSSDAILYGGSSAGLSPNTTAWTAELDYIPFSHGGPAIWPWLNARLGLQYVYFPKFNGGGTNFDGNGRNAHDNNTLFLFAWLAF